MNRHFKRSRRHFLKQSAASIAGLAVAAGVGSKALQVQAAMTERHHLINIQGGGGWDAFWWHASYPASQAQFTDAALYSRILDDRGNLIRTLHNLYTRRHADSGFMTHPRRPDVVLGMGMKHVFGSNPSLFDDILVWKGIQKDSDHGIGNRLILHGSLSQYALSFSTLFAMKFAEARLRPLHFVQISPTPGALSTNWAFAKGAGIPINIADYPAFRALTQPSTNEFSIASRRDIINNAVTRLTQAIGIPSLQLRNSKSVYQSFLDSFNGALTIGGSNVADSPAFKYIWKSYVLAGMSSLEGLYGSNFLGLIDPTALGHNFIQLNALGALSDMAKARDSRVNGGITLTDLPSPSEVAAATTPDAQAALMPRVNDFLQIRDTVGGYYGTLVDVGFSYAMAEFLVKNDLSACVDIGTPCGDYHDKNDAQVAAMTITMTYFRKLIENLKSYQVAGTGKSLLDITTVVMNTELDRTPALTINTDETRRGTNHGATTSMLLAGYGINTGGVVGDVKTGPGGPFTPVNGSGQQISDAFPNTGYSGGLPVDFATGRASQSGSYVNTKSLLPTLLQIHDIAIPPNQITDCGPIPFLLKKK